MVDIQGGHSRRDAFRKFSHQPRLAAPLQAVRADHWTASQREKWVSPVSMHSGGGCPGPPSSQTSSRGPRWPLGPALPPRRNPAASQSHALCLPPNPLTSCPFSLGGLSYSLGCSQFRGSFLLSIQFRPSFKSTRKEMERWPVQGSSMGVEHLTTWSFLPKTRGHGTAATNNPQETLPMGLTSYCKTKQHTQHECAARCWSRSRKRTTWGGGAGRTRRKQDAERTWWRLPTPPAFEPSPMPSTLHVKSSTASRTADPCSNILCLLLH